ncbi:MAG: hypothetical protein J5642_04740 [Bacteroidales bacterium]|nr:hypothetical protein [Bacteroidales bacterium]
MKQYRFLLFAFAVCALTLQLNAGNGYSTLRLQKIAAEISIIRFDTLSVGAHEFNWGGRQLHVRVNEWHEVDHIGLKLFHRQNSAGQQPIALDFMERYLLELMLDGGGEQTVARLEKDKVFIETGELSDFLSLSDTDDFALSCLASKSYRMSWKKSGMVFLSVVFPIDYQLLSGCNTIELENNYLRDIQRYAPDQSRRGVRLPSSIDTNAVPYSVEEGGTYLNNTIRHDLYYVKDSAGWSLLCRSDKPYWSAYNILLSPVSVGEFSLSVIFDKYGYETDTFSMPMNEWISYCEEDGGTPYFGVKTKDSSCIAGVVLVPYEDRGFCHMMKVEIPLDAIEKGRGKVTGRLFVFVPLHNLYEGFFDSQFILRKENYEYE